jgi:hypothetical protein
MNSRLVYDIRQALYSAVPGGTINSTCSCPGTDVPGYFHSPLRHPSEGSAHRGPRPTTPAHEARAGDPGSPPQRTKRAPGTPAPRPSARKRAPGTPASGLCPIVPFTLCRTLRGSPSYCSPTPTSRSGLGSVAPSALCAMPIWALSCIWGTESVVLGRSLPTGLTIILFSCPDLTFGVSLRSGRVKTLPYRRVAPSSTPAHEARAGDPGYGALPNRSLHLVSHPTGLAIILFTYPDLTVGARLCRAFGALCDADMGTVVYLGNGKRCARSIAPYGAHHHILHLPRP